MSDNKKASEVFAAIKNAVIRLDNVLSRNLTLAHVFQHTFVTHLVTKDDKAELQSASTWAKMNADDLQNALNELPFKSDLSNIFTAKQWAVMYLIATKHPAAKDASKDMISLTRYVDGYIHFAKLQLPVKTSKAPTGTKTGKGI